LSLKFFTAVGDGVKIFLPLSATAEKIFKHCRRQRFKKYF